MKRLTIYNTLGRKSQTFKPLKGKTVSFYHCGATVYWRQHIGNLRSVVLADAVARTLGYFGYKVKMVRNYTDVGHLSSDTDEGEDKMIIGAKREKLTPIEIASKYIGLYEADVARLNVQPPTVAPKATEHIPEMIAMVGTLLKKGFAYATPLAIYFDVSKAKDYTRLSGQNLELNRRDAGHGDIADPDKHHAADFTLWFFRAGTHAHALQYWPSPFTSPLVENGNGFPGWHIECSAMAKKYLGPTLDLHMGGVEHIPVHHTNEIAQSESANGKPFVRFWLHNEHLLLDNGKMSKSDGNIVTLDDVIDRGYDPLALRYLYLQAHYRSKQNFTWQSLDAAQSALTKLRQYIQQLQNIKVGKVVKKSTTEFEKALADDFNTAAALAVVWDLLKTKNKPGDILATLLDFDQVLGLNLKDSLKIKAIPQEVTDLAEQRQQARAAKDFAQADAARLQIEALGYAIKDTADGYQLEPLITSH
ncbi:MAG: cysteine--tRNA ligase [Candidatus Buchananbacteria bacterium]|nr:cysteine--tRNA ligase [Candidatus Buchananbacteria bacterium]